MSSVVGSRRPLHVLPSSDASASPLVPGAYVSVLEAINLNGTPEFKGRLVADVRDLLRAGAERALLSKGWVRVNPPRYDGTREYRLGRGEQNGEVAIFRQDGSVRLGVGYDWNLPVIIDASADGRTIFQRRLDPGEEA